MSFKNPNESIIHKLAFAFGVLSFCIALAYALCLRVSLRESLTRQIHNELEFRYSLTEPLLQAATTPQGWEAVRSRLVRLSNSEGGRVRYWVLSNEPAFRVGGTPSEQIARSAQNDGFSEIDRSDQDKCPLFILTRTIKYNNTIPLRLIVSLDSTPYMGTLKEFTRILIFITTIGILFVVIVGFFILRKGMRPVELLSQQAHRLSPGVSGQRLNATALPRELRGLADAFNGVLSRQEKAWTQLESFNADVAHELRTPLASITGQTQLALSRKRTATELEDCLTSNLEEVDRMSSIVNDMLFLSHAQTGKYQPHLAPVSLREEAIKTAEYTEPSFTDRHLQLTIHGDAGVCVDRRLFARSLANLLENSARYAHEHSEVFVTLSSDERLATVEVKNYGDPIEPHHLERLFERFYRVDNSRTQSNSNHGLGLSIVRAIAQIHGGETFVSSSDGMNTFGFTLRVDKASA